MGIADVTENAILNLVFRNVAWANYADPAATANEANVVWALHTADPGDAGAQNTTEAAYGSYARVNVVRTGGTGMSAASGGITSPAANVDFPSSSGAGATVTHFSTGKSGGGASAILWSGTVSPNIAIGASGITPRLTTATQITLT